MRISWYRSEIVDQPPPGDRPGWASTERAAWPLVYPSVAEAPLLTLAGEHRASVAERRSRS